MKSCAFAVAAVLISFSAHAKTVLVTGSNRGIGLEFVTQYAAAGWDVIATSRSPGDDTDLQALAAANANVKIEELDVTDLDEIAALAKKLEGTAIDVLINNAGMFGARDGQTWGQLDRDLFDQVMAVNVYGPLKVTEAFAPHVAASDEKKVVVISSAAGSIAAVSSPPGAPYYAISKSAVNMAMRGTAMRLKEDGISVGIFHPGGVDTRMLREAFGLSQAEAEANEDYDYRGFTPLSPQDSVAQMRAVITGLNAENTGSFLRYDGDTVRW